MGCCASTNHKAVSAPQQHRHSKAALPPEEETVKEVLSETPTPKTTILKIEDAEKKRASRPALHKIHEEDNRNVDNTLPLMTTEVSELSEICSLSESVSTVTEKREDDDGEVWQRVDRSPAKFRNRAFSGDWRERTTTVGKSPARRSEPSPGRVRSVTGKERRAVAAEGQKRDSGESSGRRSRSPATRAAEVAAGRAGLGRSPSARKTGKSPGRAQSELPEKTRKLEETTQWPPPTTNESLENPLVSLECFIFL